MRRLPHGAPIASVAGKIYPWLPLQPVLRAVWRRSISMSEQMIRRVAGRAVAETAAKLG